MHLIKIKILCKYPSFLNQICKIPVYCSWYTLEYTGLEPNRVNALNYMHLKNVMQIHLVRNQIYIFVKPLSAVLCTLEHMVNKPKHLNALSIMHLINITHIHLVRNQIYIYNL